MKESDETLALRELRYKIYVKGQFFVYLIDIWDKTAKLFDKGLFLRVLDLNRTS